MTRVSAVRLMTALVMKEAGLFSGSGSKPKLACTGILLIGTGRLGSTGRSKFGLTGKRFPDIFISLEMGGELHSDFAGPIQCRTKLTLIYVLSEGALTLPASSRGEEKTGLEQIRYKNVSPAEYAIDCLVCRWERKGRSVDSCCVPTPAEVSPTSWDG